MASDGATNNWPENACYSKHGRDDAHVFSKFLSGYKTWCNYKYHGVYSRGAHTLESTENNPFGAVLVYTWMVVQTHEQLDLKFNHRNCHATCYREHREDSEGE